MVKASENLPSLDAVFSNQALLWRDPESRCALGSALNSKQHELFTPERSFFHVFVMGASSTIDLY